MVSPNDILELLVHYERVNNKIRMLQAKPIDYGTGDKIYYSELQLMKAVKNYPDKNISDFAKMFGITKGAISQTANKLLDRGYLRKFKFEDNKKEVYLKLTDKGKTVVENAYASYEPMIKELIKFAGKDDKKIRIIHEFLDVGEKIIENSE
jgi:DNA-binding MarR family transcriptional regulator